MATAESVEEAERAFDQARVALEDARKRMREARTKYDDEQARKLMAIEREIGSMQQSPQDLGERIADAARSHGNLCVENGEAYTSPQWRRFRTLLAALVKRASEAEARVSEASVGQS